MTRAQRELSDIRRIVRRSPKIGLADLGMTATAILIAGCVEIGLRTLPLPRLARMLGIPLRTTPKESIATDGRRPLPLWARRRLAASRRALRHWPGGGSCLRTALVGGYLIRRLGPGLRIGVAKHAGEIRAHAWIELYGLSLDPASRDFATIERDRP